MALKPWYRVVTPREDLREGKPLDASEFAVHLDQVRDGRAPTDYQKPERFFDRTYLTSNLTSPVRRGGPPVCPASTRKPPPSSTSPRSSAVARPTF